MSGHTGTSKGQFSKTMSGRRISSRMEDLSIKNVPFYFNKESSYDILKSLRILKEDINLGNSINWNILYCVITEFNIHEETLPYCVSFLLEICKLFVKYRCKEISLVAVVLYIIVNAGPHRRSMIYVFYPFFQQGIHYAVIMNRIRTQFYGWYHKGYRQLLTAAVGANLGGLKLLLKFGMVYPSYVHAKHSVFLKCLLQTIRFNHIEFSPEVYHSIIVKLDAYNEDNEASAYSILRPNKRTMLIIAALEIVTEIKKNENFSEKYCMCYKLLLDSTEESYVTCTDVRIFLQSLLPESCNNEIFRFVAMFKTLLPHVSEAQQPRSLKHLCRIRIRESLRQNYNLPHGVSSLKLPRILKKYVLLDDDEYPTEMFSLHFPQMNYKIPDVEDCVVAYIKNM